jgi:glycyl-tRNA synthetase beta chain
MSTTRNLLVELQVEELPPKALKKLGEAFADNLFSRLELNDFLEVGAARTGYATPRRLAVHISNVRERSVPRPVPDRTLMPATVGIKDGEPTPPLLKKLRGIYNDDVDIAWLMQERVYVAEERGKSVVKHRERLAAGSLLAVALDGLLESTVESLPILKVMTYQLANGWSNVHFVRPAHSLIALHGSEVVPVSALGLQAGRATVGHRFEATTKPLVIRDADSYAEQLGKEGAVIAGFAERRAEIQRQLQAAGAAAGLRPIEDDALLDEVTGLVERPNVLTCQFEPEFLDVPQECLILTMKANQKYFPLLDANGRLTNKFLIVSNIRPADPSAVITGNERVVRPRLADAKFFYDQDRKATLESRVDGLGNVVYHAKLGSQLDRVHRVTSIAVQIAQAVNANVAHVELAAHLAKADLRTLMVGEFPELQGTMGRYYFQHDVYSAAQAENRQVDSSEHEIAAAIEEHYRPRFAGDALPASMVGLCVALADKIETLVGLFGIGERPTGEKDPFALRRHALGVLRMLMEAKLPLPLDRLLAIGTQAFAGVKGFADPASELTVFIYDRLRGVLRDEGYSANEIEAVVALSPVRIDDVKLRLAAVRAFAALPEADSLAAANKRISNILKKSDGAAGSIDSTLLFEPAEKSLAEALAATRPQAERLFAAGDYTGMLKSLAPLKLPVDKFFNDVMVNVDDQKLRANRLALLAALRAEMNRVADLSLLAAG